MYSSTLLYLVQCSLPVVGPGDFPFSRETCAVCWEKLSFARELPCKHKFHL